MTRPPTTHGRDAEDNPTNATAGTDSPLASEATGAEPAAAPRSLRRVSCLAVTHRTHSQEQIGDLAPADPVAVASEIAGSDRVVEAMVLSTCNRVEVYVSHRTPTPADRAAAFDAVADAIGRPTRARTYTGLTVARHLARVAAGLESAVLGEDEIAGQVSNALAAAKEAGLVAGVLDRVGNTALRAGRACRTETAIDDGPTGYGGAVCRVLGEELDEQPDRLLLVGAGEVASTVAATVRRRWESRVDVANRSPVQDLQTDDGRWWPLEDLDAAIRDADAVVTATGANRAVIETEHLRIADGMPIVDLATPPDVARTGHDCVVVDFEDVAATVREATERRRDAVRAAEAVIDDALDRLVERERENRAEEVIRALHREAAAIREAELERALNRLDDGQTDPEVVLEEFASALTGRLLGAPTDTLRTAARERDETAIRAARRLFDLEETGGENR
jgi:glutamyl-tRNA reductase